MDACIDERIIGLLSPLCSMEVVKTHKVTSAIPIFSYIAEIFKKWDF